MKRSEVFTEDALAALSNSHPYLALFQKEDWREYLSLIAQIYDLLEEENARIPFEVLKSLVIRFYSHKKLQFLENKVHSFFAIMIGELAVLRDSHDQFGQRFVETTRSGKELLQFVEGLLDQRTRFSGTGAESLLGALNGILISRERLTAEQAIQHHRERIKAYQKDIQCIETEGLARADLLPMPHSNEALFSQAEEAARHILSSIEDVKDAIERQRQELAQSYFETVRTAGRNLSAIADFYEGLHRSNEYRSYGQAKQLLSYLEGFGARFTVKNVDHLLHEIGRRDLIPADDIRRSHVHGFMRQFENSDRQIQEKIRAQIKLLQQQVHYALNTDVRGAQASLGELLALLVRRRDEAVAFFETSPLEMPVPSDFDIGDVVLHDLVRPRNVEGVGIDLHALEENERRALLDALLQAEETTLSEILDRFLVALREARTLSLADYPIAKGFAEYYVLCEIELFDGPFAKITRELLI